MKKILILGKDGMAGHVITKYLSSLGKYDIVATSNKKESGIFFDANEPKQILEIIKSEKPNIVINCIGVLVKSAEENVKNAVLINSYLPHLIADYAKEYNFKLIHLSTDCVFSGEKGNYHETDITDAFTNYGRTKALGEIKDNDNLTIRMSIIGPEIKESGTGLLHWFFKQHGTLDGYSNVFWTGVTTLQLAKSVEEILNKNISGIIQLVPDKKISKYDLLNLASTIFDKKIEIRKNTDKKEDRSLIPNSEIHVPDYKTMLVELKEWMIENKNQYNTTIYEFLK